MQPADALQSACISHAHESCLAIQLKPIKSISQNKLESTEITITWNSVWIFSRSHTLNLPMISGKSPSCTLHIAQILVSLVSEGTHWTTYWTSLSEYLEFLNQLHTCRAQPVCLLVLQAGLHTEPNHTKALAGLFTAAWQHPWRLQVGTGGLMGDSAEAGQLHPTCSHHDQLSAHQQPRPQPATQCALQTSMWLTWIHGGASMMSCKIFKQSCQVQFQRFYQRDKAKSWSGLKLHSTDGDWDVDFEQWLECLGYSCKIF